MEDYNYYVNEQGTMLIYYGTNVLVAEISDCKGMKKKDLDRLFEDVISERG